MKQIHVECLPDETLAKKLGFTKRSVTHHAGKSRVFYKLQTVKNQLAIVDEDPKSVKSSYEKTLTFLEEAEGAKLYEDKLGNKVVVLQGKLEDWIISSCKRSKIELTNLPEDPNELHSVINQRINRLEELIDILVKKKDKGFSTIKNWLK